MTEDGILRMQDNAIPPAISNNTNEENYEIKNESHYL